MLPGFKMSTSPDVARLANDSCSSSPAEAMPTSLSGEGNYEAPGHEHNKHEAHLDSKATHIHTFGGSSFMCMWKCVIEESRLI